jgi:hypothetical protein
MMALGLLGFVSALGGLALGVRLAKPGVWKYVAAAVAVACTAYFVHLGAGGGSIFSITLVLGFILGFSLDTRGREPKQLLVRMLLLVVVWLAVAFGGSLIGRALREQRPAALEAPTKSLNAEQEPVPERR